ncbi:MAG: hypothetical protein ACI9XO_001694 [Paraglaciecola sp.]|jgi:hypothetical protein
MKIYLTALCLLLFGWIFSNNPSKTATLNLPMPVLNCESPFLKAIGSPNDDNICFDMVQDNTGNFWISGRENNQSMLLQVNSDGEILQQLGFDFTNGEDFSRFLLLDSDGMLLTDGRDQPTPY